MVTAAFACSHEREAPATVAPIGTPQVLRIAHEVASREPLLAARLARRGWSSGAEGITSSAWASPPSPGRERLASHLPERADGAWQSKIAGSRNLGVAVRVVGSQPTAAEVVDGRVLYRDTFTSTHTVFSADEHEAELNFVLLDERAPRSFTLELDRTGGELSPRQHSEALIAFVDRSGRSRLLLGGAYAVDAAGVRRAAPYDLDGNRIRVELDTTGLQYPIVLDPPLVTPAWTEQSPATVPPARIFPGMATLGSKVVMFGGHQSDNTFLDDTWEWDGTNWTERNPVSRPSAREPYGQMVGFGDHVILFSGGIVDDIGPADTWKWDGTTWTQLAPATSPPARGYGNMFVLNGSVYLYGGNSSDGFLADTWVWNGTTWSELAINGPSSRYLAAAAVYANSEVLLFGGNNQSENLGDTWSFDGSAWTELTPLDSPAPMYAAGMASLPGSVVLYGGLGDSPFAGTYEWNGSTWVMRSPTDSPGARLAHGMAALNGGAVMFGGMTADWTSDTWLYGETLAANAAACTTGSECVSGHCVDGICCDTACAGGSSDCQACDLAGSAGTCTPIGAGVECRAAAGDCDVAESCDGNSAACPADAKKPAATSCRASAGDCDVAETCDGVADACPDDSKRASGFECRASAGDCDVAETCDGMADACPDDSKRASGFECRASAGDCDVAETCNGTDAACPADGVRANGTSCRAAAGLCDVAEVCNGSTAACPNDAVLTNGTTCRAAAGLCDVAEVCNGSTGACPADAVRVAGFSCRVGAGECDVPESCDGSSPACPDDQFVPNTVVCRDASCDAGVQTDEARCTGSSAACPATVTVMCDAYQCGPDACYTSCTDASQCAPQHYCDGTACHPQLADGATCTASDQCTSGECVDGYCCNVACAGQCEACDVEDRLGVCTAVLGEPHGDREPCDSDGTSCGGSCDGDTRNACFYPGSSEVCRDASCADDVATDEATCGGDGTCGPRITQACAPFLCNAEETACAGDCVVDGDCASGAFCSLGVCMPKRALGAACSGENQCASGRCVDDVCCNAACSGQCEACDVDGVEGTCSAVVGEPHGERDACAGDGSECDGECNGVTRTACSYPDGATNCRLGSCSAGTAIVAAFCDGAGACPALQTQSCAPFMCGGDACLGDCSEDSDCVSGSFCNANVCTAKRALGEACGGDNACGSNFCVDGFCCENGCEGQCEACDIAGSEGTCTAVIGAPHGTRPDCDSDGSACGGACDGSDPDGCAYPEEDTFCRNASCTDAVATLAARCVGTGSCPIEQTQACAPYACGATQCSGNCADSAGCSEGNYCSAGVCTPRLAQGVACGSNDQCSSGMCVDGYCCDGTCEGQCEACDVAGKLGTCSPVAGAPHGGRDACAGAGTCAGSCDGVATQACTYPSTAVTCTNASCSNGTATRAATCDGAGTCTTAAHRDCSPYVCGATDCTSSCTSDGGCVDGRVCRDGTCELPEVVDAGVDEPDAAMAADAGVDAGAPEPDGGAIVDPDGDSDGDGIPDVEELGKNGQSLDTDDDGIPNERDGDDDGDGIPTRAERASGSKNDLDRDGVPNYLDSDADGDGIDDEDESKGDLDRDGIPDYKDPARIGIAGGALCAVQQGGDPPAGAAWVLLTALTWLFARRRQLV